MVLALPGVGAPAGSTSPPPAVMPTRSHRMPCWGHHPGTAPRHGGPYRLPWKADPWRAWLSREPRLAGQPLGSHEARVTLEGKWGVSVPALLLGALASTPQNPHLPSDPWGPPRKSLRAGPAGRGAGCEDSICAAPCAPRRGLVQRPDPVPCGVPQGMPRYRPALLTSRPGRPGLPCSPPSPFSPFWPCGREKGGHPRHLPCCPGRHRRVLAPLPPSWDPRGGCPHCNARTLGWAALTFCPSAPTAPGSPCGGTAGQSGCPRVGSRRASLLLAPPPLSSHHHPLSCLLGAGPPRPSLGYAREVGWGGTAGFPPHGPIPLSITYRLAALSLLALRPLGALGRRKRRERSEGGGGQQSRGGEEHGRFGGVLPARGHRGGCAHSQRPAGGGKRLRGSACTGHGRGWGAMGGRSTPSREPGTPAGIIPRAGGSLAGTWLGTLTRSPFSPLPPAVPGRPRSPFPPCKRAEVRVTRRGTGVPISTRVPHGSQAGMFQAQPRVCVATSLLELSWGVTNLPLDLGDPA